MDAFTVSGLMHEAGIWALGRGTELRTVGGFFLLMGALVIDAWARRGMIAADSDVFPYGRRG